MCSSCRHLLLESGAMIAQRHVGDPWRQPQTARIEIIPEVINHRRLCHHRRYELNRHAAELSVVVCNDRKIRSRQRGFDRKARLQSEITYLASGYDSIEAPPFRGVVVS